MVVRSLKALLNKPAVYKYRWDRIKSILIFLSELFLASDTTGVHERPKLLLWHLFLERPAPLALKELIAFIAKLQKRQDEVAVPWCAKATNYSHKMNATDDLITRTRTNIIRITQAWNKSPTEHEEALWGIVPKCNRVFDAYVLKTFFLKVDQNRHDIVCF